MSDAKFSSAENLQQMLNSFAGFLYYYAIKIAREVTLIKLKNEKRILHFLPFMWISYTVHAYFFKICLATHTLFSFSLTFSEIEKTFTVS